MTIQSQKDFLSGLLFIGCGGAFAWGATAYSFGSSARIGPAYFPMVVGLLLALLGSVITVKSLVVKTADGDKVGPLALKPLFFVITANLVFGLLLGGLPELHVPPMGLVAAIVALTLIASMAGEEFKLGEVLVLAVILAILSYVAFILLLKLQIPVWPAFITG